MVFRATAEEPAMLSTFDRSDTLLGVCEALGQDLGVNATWLRVMFAVGVLWSPVVMIATYLGLGVVVAVARAVTPVRRPTPMTPATIVDAANDAADHQEMKQAA